MVVQHPECSWMLDGLGAVPGDAPSPPAWLQCPFSRDRGVRVTTCRELVEVRGSRVAVVRGSRVLLLALLLASWSSPLPSPPHRSSAITTPQPSLLSPKKASGKTWAAPKPGEPNTWFPPSSPQQVRGWFVPRPRLSRSLNSRAPQCVCVPAVRGSAGGAGAAPGGSGGRRGRPGGGGGRAGPSHFPGRAAAAGTGGTGPRRKGRSGDPGDGLP